MHGEQHSIRICGHKINWHKPIKPYAIIKHALVLALFSFPVLAAEITSVELVYPVLSSSQNSPSLAPARLQTPNVAEKSVTGQAGARDQRTAGSSSLSPAMALAMALGMRNAAGPWEYSPKTVSPSTKDVNHLTGFERRDALAGQVADNARTLSKKENIYK